jgi:hypothetical protein
LPSTNKPSHLVHDDDGSVYLAQVAGCFLQQPTIFHFVEIRPRGAHFATQAYCVERTDSARMTKKRKPEDK